VRGELLAVSRTIDVDGPTSPPESSCA
jgi:hypothetical protein